MTFPRRNDRGPQRPRIDTSEFQFPRPQDRAKKLAIAAEQNAKLREESAALRKVVYGRDHGVCTTCGLDTEALYDCWQKAIRNDLAQYDCNICGQVTREVPCIHCSAKTCSRSFEHRTIFRRSLIDLGFPQEYARKYNGATLWHADHEVAVVDGGGGLGDANARTLCIPCHIKVTSYQAETRALRRRSF